MGKASGERFARRCAPGYHINGQGAERNGHTTHHHHDMHGITTGSQIKERRRRSGEICQIYLCEMGAFSRNLSSHLLMHQMHEKIWRKGSDSFCYQIDSFCYQMYSIVLQYSMYFTCTSILYFNVLYTLRPTTLIGRKWGVLVGGEAGGGSSVSGEGGSVCDAVCGDGGGDGV